MTVDLSALRSITADDPALEQEMFVLFNATARRCLENALAALQDNNNDAWQSDMQELYGAAKNIGAYELAGACRIAIDAQEFEKRRMLMEEITNKAREAQLFLQSVTY